jgi:hypothetical protein
LDIADPVSRAIQAQRSQLRRAHSVLVCLRYAADYCDSRELDAADVTEVVAALIDKANEELDDLPLLRAAERIRDDYQHDEGDVE